MKNVRRFGIHIFIGGLLLLLLVLTSCGSVTYTWQDENGKVLYTMTQSRGEAAPRRALPPGGEDWYYAGWTESVEGSNVIFSAERVQKRNVTWKDSEGTVLASGLYRADEELPERPLPEDTETRHYVGWEETVDGNSVTVTAAYIEKSKVNWYDADGTLLDVSYYLEEDGISMRALPQDTDEWIYTGWTEIDGEGESAYRAERMAKTKVIWKDAEGKVLYTEGIVPNARIPERALPENNSRWVYTGWTQSKSGNTVVCTARRVAAKTVIWRHADGEEIARSYIPTTEALPQRELPFSKKWEYTKWQLNITGTTSKVYTYTAVGNPKTSYFVGNVFQLVAEDLAGNPIAVGTGFVFDREGWFITNYHVMDGAYGGTAIFDIRNAATGEAFTKLKVSAMSNGSSRQADLFIGKLENYSRISSYYNEMSMGYVYNVGDATFSVGYPGDSGQLEIHRGNIMSNVSTLADKLYSGFNYIASSSYVAPGSSGGILVNDRLEVIGLTTRRLDLNGEFVLGASIEAFNLQKYTVKTSTTFDVALMMHPNEQKFVRLFRNCQANSKAVKVSDQTGTYYRLTWDNQYSQSRVVTSLSVYSDGRISYMRDDYWTNGDHMTQLLSGIYSSQTGIADFAYSFNYDFSTGDYYSLMSGDVNYSDDISETLRHYTMTGSSFSVFAKDIQYARERFNSLYSWLEDYVNA